MPCTGIPINTLSQTVLFSWVLYNVWNFDESHFRIHLVVPGADGQKCTQGRENCLFYRGLQVVRFSHRRMRGIHDNQRHSDPEAERWSGASTQTAARHFTRAQGHEVGCRQAAGIDRKASRWEVTEDVRCHCERSQHPGTRATVPWQQSGGVWWKTRHGGGLGWRRGRGWGLYGKLRVIRFEVLTQKFQKRHCVSLNTLNDFSSHMDGIWRVWSARLRVYWPCRTIQATVETKSYDID